MKSLLVILALVMTVVAHGAFEIEKSIENIGGNTNSYFGNKIASNSDFFVALLVGTYGNANAQYQLYGRDQGGTNNWGFVKSLTESNSDGTGIMAGSKVAMSEDHLVFVDSYADGVATETGKLYIYSRNQGGTDNWGFVKSTAPAGLSASSRIGSHGDTLSISGDSFFIGSRRMYTVWGFDKDAGGANNWGEVVSLQGKDLRMDEEFGQERVVVRGDRLFVGAGGYQPVGQSLTQAWGAAYVFDRNEGGTNNWGQKMIIGPELLNTHTAGTIINGDFAFREFDVTSDGSLLAFYSKRNPDGITSQGSIVVLGKDVGGIDNWGIVTTFASNVPAINQNFGSEGMRFSLDGKLLFISNKYKIEVRGRHVGGTDNWGFVQVMDFGVGEQSDRFGQFISLSGTELVASSSYWDDPGGNSNVGRVLIISIPPCESSTDCDSGFYCGATDLKCVQTVCANHGECFGDFLSGRVPFCNTVAGFCEDKFAGTCTTSSTCTLLAGKKNAESKSVGSASHVVSITNTTLARQTAKKLATDILAGTSVTKDIFTVVSVEETVVMSSLYFDAVGNNVDALDHIKSVVCGDIGVDYCTVTIPTRRMLVSRELATSVTVSVTYEVDIDVFNTLQEAGSFTDPAFIDALAAAAGVDPGNVTVIVSGGSFTIDYTVMDESDGDDPLIDAALQAITDLEADIENITSAVVSELGIGAGDISAAVLDKCGGRDCNGRGTCNESTGACACTDADYWGINCETLVNCNNGTKADSIAYCRCIYPSSGRRCELTANCHTCGT